MCNLYNSQVKITWVWGQGSCFEKCLNQSWITYVLFISHGHHSAWSTLHYKSPSFLALSMFKFSLQILLSMEWFIWGQVLQRIDFWDQKWPRLLRLQHETFKISSQSRKALIGLWCGMTNRNTLYFALGLILEKWHTFPIVLHREWLICTVWHAPESWYPMSSAGSGTVGVQMCVWGHERHAGAPMARGSRLAQDHTRYHRQTNKLTLI